MRTPLVIVAMLAASAATTSIGALMVPNGHAGKHRTRIGRITVSHLPAGAAVTVRCARGSGCAYAAKRLRVRGGQAVERHMTFGAGGKLRVRVSAPGRKAQLRRYRLVSGRLPGTTSQARGD